MHISAVITGSADTRTGYRNEQSYNNNNNIAFFPKQVGAD
jgi:hypothetical protein